MKYRNTIQLEIPTSAKYLNVLGESIRSMLAHVSELENSADTIYQIQLAVHEICNNVIEHAHANTDGRIEIVLTINMEERYFSADVYDHGLPFDPSSVPEPNLDEPQEKGYGVFLARQLMDEVLYTSTTEHNHWYLMKKV